MALQIYIPGVNGTEAAEYFAGVGLAELLAPRDRRPMSFESEQTPDTGRGSFWSWAKQSELGYVPGLQTWRPALPDPDKGLPAGRYWWSLPNRPVGPADFARDVLLDGPQIPCGDGAKWQFPNGVLLPHGHGLDPETGRFCRKVTADYERIYELSRWALTHWTQAIQAGSFDLAACFRVSIELLQANYRITRDVVAHLGLLGDQTVQQVMFLCTETDVLFQIQNELQKKSGVVIPGT